MNHLLLGRARRCLTALTLAFAFAGTAMAVEEPSYSVSLQAGDAEVRDYPALIAAEVTVSPLIDSDMVPDNAWSCASVRAETDPPRI